MSSAPRRYVYQFDHKNEKWGAAHAIELGFVFNGIRNPDCKGYLANFTGDATKRTAMNKLSDDMMDTWAEFARSGDPSNKAVGTFPKLESGKLMVLGSGPEARHAPRGVVAEWETLRALSRRIAEHVAAVGVCARTA